MVFCIGIFVISGLFFFLRQRGRRGSGPWDLYQADEEDVEFVETPYFHELTQGVGGSGQMGLTPLGRTLNAKAS